MRIRTWVKKVNISEARAHFSKLLARVQLGEEIVVAKAASP
ncbi:MAG: type II toxin-antitoxin system Phd/YefM family antitoxin [Terriglobales bacterium]